MASKKKQPRGANLDNIVRIIGGKWRGRKISFQSTPGLRPTPDRVRETLFNWLSPVIEDANCLDLFAGSGAMGLEALSRGAAQVTMIDSSSRVVRSLQQCLTMLNCSGATLVNTNALDWLAVPRGKSPFNIIFLDPPFQQGLVDPCCKLLEANDFLGIGSYIYIESERSSAHVVPDCWHLHRSKFAGNVAYSVYIKRD